MSKESISIQEQVYQSLRSQILSFQLPPGTSMSTQDAADRLHVSRTPVREAFIRLERDGLVQMYPKRETLVSPISLSRVSQEHFLRQSLELSVLPLFPWETASECLMQMNQLVLKQMTAGVKNDFQEFLRLDDQFHALLFITADMLLPWKLITENSTHYQRIRLLSLRQKNRVEQVIIEHQELLRALEIGRLRTASEILENHLLELNNEQIDLQQLYPKYFLGSPASFKAKRASKE